ncbi:MAG: hypothetical protein JRD05_00775 [Deltaproteobacteria bacterium]|nr:hypothetical protein [Deltaproteobacteria bacterium]
MNYLSIDGVDLAHFWDSHVIRFDAPQRSLAKNHGGYCSLGFGGISFSHDLFTDDWPPPVNGVITVKYTATTEAAAETIFEGVAHLSKINREEIRYELYGPSYTATVNDATAYNDTLVAVMTTLCGVGILNLTLDSSAARGPSPNVTHTVDGDQLAIELASEICAFYSHLFYIVGSTLYLVDMLGDNGTQTITEFDFFPSDYNNLVPVALARSGDYSRTSAYPYGNELSVDQYHDTEANVNTALDNIIAIENKARCDLKIPLLGSLPVPGKKISWTDTSLGVDTDMYIRARALRYDFDNEEITISGEGEISAA